MTRPAKRPWKSARRTVTSKAPLSGYAASPSLASLRLREGDDAIAARRLLLGVFELGHACLRKECDD
ncbi:MAG: hypothetical protein E2583_15915 [Comamonas sp.]|nr:hypothetical protein [Comamonas sp.]